MLTADGVPLKKSLARALRREKLRALALIAPLLIFILITFIAPIGDMLFRSVKNEIVSQTLPRTVVALEDWNADSGQAPDNTIFSALHFDLFIAAERKAHTRLGQRLNYEKSGMSSLFRKTGRRVDDMAKDQQAAFIAADPALKDPTTFIALFAEPDWSAREAEWIAAGSQGKAPRLRLNEPARAALPQTAAAYEAFATFTQVEDGKSPTKTKVWELVYAGLYEDLSAAPNAPAGFTPALDATIAKAYAATASIAPVDFRAEFAKADKDWLNPEIWTLMKTYSSPYTAGYFLRSIDLQLGADGVTKTPENERIYIRLFIRTILMSMAITISCILLGYPVAWLLANLPTRTSNLLMILVLLPFWTSLLVRTSAWKALLQQQGVINDILVWLNLVGDAERLVMINNVTGTIIAMTHILLPFMILPLYSVMQTIPQTYLRAAKSLGATNWTAFWRVYFPQSIPGIGAGSILVFILSIGYYITPEIVGGTKGVFISNRIAYHISASLNWGLAAALGAILLAAVMLLYYAYDRIVGIDNVKLG
ncbi:MAG: ABC transporter permease [Paracoccaceae bacterium]